MDRMITLKVGHHDLATEVAITQAKSGLSWADSRAIVDIVREFRALGARNARPTIRACIRLGRIVAARNGVVAAGDRAFRELCQDVFNDDCSKVTHDGHPASLERLDEILERCCPCATATLAGTPEANPIATPLHRQRAHKLNGRGVRHVD
jgi:hypothetical protein